MAALDNTSFQATEHQVNTGTTTLPARWQWALTNASHDSTKALSAIEIVTGCARANGMTSKVVKAVVVYSVTSGTPAPKDVTLYFFSKAAFPADTPAANSAQLFAVTDAPFMLGSCVIATADWIISDKIARVEKDITVHFQNADTTVGTSMYVFAMNGTTTWTPTASSTLDVTIWMTLN